MNIKDQLTSLGWSIKAEFFENNKQQIDDIQKQLLNIDLRQYGEKALPEMSKLDQTAKSYIVQLHKTRNVTASKDNELSSNRSHLYRLTITDGITFQNALILPSLKNFNLDTPPGTKLVLKPKTKISHGFYILNDQTCEVIGGIVNELVHKWKFNKLMGKHIRTVVGEEAPPPWVPFGSEHASTTTVDTSKRSMDVAKMQQTNEEDPEFVRQRRTAIDTLLTDQTSKMQRFAKQNTFKGTNVAKAFEQISQPMLIDRQNTAFNSSTVSNKTSNRETTTAAIKTNSRLPEWAKHQIADEAIEDEKRRAQSDRKQHSKRNFDDETKQLKRGLASENNRRNRGHSDYDDGGEEKRSNKDVTLFDFLETKTKSATSKSQNRDSKSTSISNQPNFIRKQIFDFEAGAQILARYHEDNQYYPAVIINIMYDTRKCMIMFEGYESQEIVDFDDIKPYEEDYYDEEEYEQEQHCSTTSQGSQSGYSYYNPQQQHRDNQNRYRPNSGRNYSQQKYSYRYNNTNYY